MLRINLLPIRQLKKRAKAKNEIAIFGVVFLCLIVVLIFIGLIQGHKISTIESTIAKLTQEQQKLTPEIAAVDRLKKDKIELERKISIIHNLKAESSLTVHILDEIANAVDNSRMWLTSLSQQGGTLMLTGIALDNQSVAQFMDTLKKSPFVQSVELSNSSLKKIADRNLKEFSLTCVIAAPQSAQDQALTKEK
ncbi:MAG: PilN domain-containing protein [Desulfocapsaceae bacterium]|nr:PilN domain-containing protein [Desulfocapsaceae bacterium]